MPEKYYDQTDFLVFESRIEMLGQQTQHQFEVHTSLAARVAALEMLCDVYSMHAKTLASHEERLVRLETDITEAVDLARKMLDKTTQVLAIVTLQGKPLPLSS